MRVAISSGSTSVTSLVGAVVVASLVGAVVVASLVGAVVVASLVGAVVVGGSVGSVVVGSLVVVSSSDSSSDARDDIVKQHARGQCSRSSSSE